MTTIDAYLDALTKQPEIAPQARRQRYTGRGAPVFLLHLSDFLMIVLAMVVAVNARGLVPFAGVTPTDHLIGLTVPFIALAWLGLLHVFGADQLRHLRAGAVEYKRVLMASFTMAGLVGIGSYLFAAEFPRGLYVVLFVAGTATLLLSRFARRRFVAGLHRRGALMTPVVVAGDSRHVDEIAKVLRRETWLGYRVVGAITRDPVSMTPSGLNVLGRLADTVAVIEEHRAATVIFAEGSFQSPADFRRMAWELEEQDIHMIVVPAFTDVSAQRLDVRPVAGLPLVDVDRPQAIEAARWIKRTFDVVGSGILLLLASPLMALTALAIKLEDGGPVLFKQTRVGHKGRIFECMKFRSMATDAEARLAELAAQNEGAGPLFKLAHDPRVTRVGRFIRRFSIDELPQLWNTFRGDMSLVGPRPALPSEVALYEPDTRRRLEVRPGLTGLWQVSGRSNLSWDDTVRLDLYYVDNWSMVQDLMILARTAQAVVGSAGAY